MSESYHSLSVSGKPLRPIVLKCDVAEITLTRGKIAIIDATDLELVAGRLWFAVPVRELWYAATTYDSRFVHLHRHLVGLDGPDIDHEDGNGLNCRRSNLRCCTHAQNMHNRRSGGGRSQFKGVSWDTQTHRWRASIQINGKRKSLGRFRLENDAARAYDDAAREAYGSFARLNLSIVSA